MPVERYRVRAFAHELLHAVPLPHVLYRLCRFYYHSKSGEDFADMSINGEVRFLRSQGPKCRVIFDVGAHRGHWTRHALAAAAAAEVHSFEPLPEHYEHLLAGRFPERVTVNPFGLSKEIGERPMFVESASLYDRRQAGDTRSKETEIVRLTTLDEYCKRRRVERIDFLKIDVEGDELAVLQGSERMIRNERILRIQFEYSMFDLYSRTLLKDFFDFFHGLPYDLYKLMPRRLLRIGQYDPRLDNFVYKNFIALHRSIPAPSRF